METAVLVTYMWAVHAALAAVVALPLAYFGRSRVTWYTWELTAFVLPFSFWLALMFVNWLPKSLSNLGEPFNISVAIPIATTLRIIIGSRIPQRYSAATLLLLLCLTAVVTYVATPVLPE